MVCGILPAGKSSFGVIDVLDLLFGYNFTNLGSDGGVTDYHYQMSTVFLTFRKSSGILQQVISGRNSGQRTAYLNSRVCCFTKIHILGDRIKLGSIGSLC